MVCWRLAEPNSVSISHAELDEDWYHSDDPINAGVTFFVKVYSTTKAYGIILWIKYNVYSL